MSDSELKTIPAEGTKTGEADGTDVPATEVKDFSAFRAWLRDDSTWFHKELDLLKTGADAASRETQNPI